MKQTTQSWWLLFPLLALFACKKEELPPKVYDVPAIVQPFIDDFIDEAAARGHLIEIDNLIVEFEGNLDNGDAAGLCTFQTDNSPPHIRLDTTSTNWKNNIYSREALVFHELGHCILDRRGHISDLLPNGNFASIMRPKGEQLYGGTINTFKREYYLDELFDPNTPVPDWAKDVPPYSDVAPAQKTTLYFEGFDSDLTADPAWSRGTSSRSIRKIENGHYYFESLDDGAYFSLISKSISRSADFELEAAIRIVKGERATMLEWGGNSAENLYFYGFTASQFAFIGNWQSGTSAARDVSNLQPGAYNKLTVRRRGDNYYFYLNEELFDNGKFESFRGNWFAFYVGSFTAIEVDYLRISRID